mmetsp:Transcript_20603/g.26551  ORF Transcript_20603/g.26551 Transcript_20603/m.26551 type:complete len:386 (-) Transcript_20603:124-1281(-)
MMDQLINDRTFIVASAASILVLISAPFTVRTLRTYLGRLYVHNVLIPRSKAETTAETEDEPKKVSSLFFHPVKSLRPIQIKTATLDSKGFVDDRRFMLITPIPLPVWKDSFKDDEASHRFLSQRQCPCLATVVAKIIQNGSAISFSSHLVPGCNVAVSTTLASPDKRQQYLAKLWDDVIQVADMGDEAAIFFRKILDADEYRLPEEYKNLEVRLVQQAPEDRRSTDVKFTPPSTRWLSTSQSPPLALVDGFPVLIATEASLEELNRRIKAKGKDPIPMTQFRPNIVVKGGKPFEEDRWKVISIDGVIFHTVKGCPRCKLSCTDQINGHVSDEPLETLREFRAMSSNPEDIFFAQNAIATAGMEGRTISENAVVKVLEWGEPVWGE